METKKKHMGCLPIVLILVGVFILFSLLTAGSTEKEHDIDSCMSAYSDLGSSAAYKLCK